MSFFSIELAFTPWDVPPVHKRSLNISKSEFKCMVGATRIELATSRPPDVRATTALSPEKFMVCSRIIKCGKLLLRKIFPLCVVQIEKINFLYFSSLSGLGDQI